MLTLTPSNLTAVTQLSVPARTSSDLTGITVTQLFGRGPDWSTALVEWGLFWDIHNYLYASIFAMIALYTIRCAIVTCRKRITKRNPQHLQNLIMFLLCSSRAFNLFADPYLQGTLFTGHKFTKLLWYLGEPGLVSIHCMLIIILATDYTTKTMLNNLSFAVMITHYVMVTVIVFVADISSIESRFPVIVLQVVFLVWGLFIGVNVFRLASMLLAKFMEEGINGGQFLINLICTCGIFKLVMLILHAYTTVTEVLDFIHPSTEYVGAWKWLATQTALRLSEIISCELVLAVLAKHRTSTMAKMLDARREEMAIHGYYHSPSISVEDAFYSLSSSQSFHSDVCTGPANEQSTGNGLANTEQTCSYMLSNQSQGYGNKDNNGKTDQSQDDVNQDGNMTEENDNYELTSQIEKQTVEQQGNKAELYQLIEETIFVPEHINNGEAENTDNNS